MDYFDLDISAKVNDKLDKILLYLIEKKGNRQAAKNVLDDYNEVLDDLRIYASVYRFCRSERLREQGYRVRLFNRHRYKLIYKIEGSSVHIDGLFHELEDMRDSI